MNILATAIQFASDCHVDQTDKGGKAYILHPIRMMMRLRTSDEELMCIAILHDVVEDCGVSFDDLRNIGMTERVIDGVNSLTKRPDETWEQFIDRICLNIDAMKVKLEDLRDNSDLTRLKGLRQKDFDRMTKYMIAFNKIETLLRTK